MVFIHERYFDVIMGMELNLQTLELANKFLRNVEIPEEFAQKMATKFVAECRRSKVSFTWGRETQSALPSFFFLGFKKYKAGFYGFWLPSSTQCKIL